MMQRALALLAVGAALTGAFGQTRPDTAPKETDTPLTYISFSHSGSSIDQCFSYAAYMDDGVMLADFCLYGAEEITGVPLDADEAQAVLALPTQADFLLWDGFHRTSRDMLDGDSFSLTMRFADGTSLSASGSNAYPEGYQAGYSAILTCFDAIILRHHLSPWEEESRHSVKEGLNDESDHLSLSLLRRAADLRRAGQADLRLLRQRL